LTSGKKIYFASDFHLGLGTPEEIKAREQLLVKWFDMIKADADEVFLVGDLFDVWFEYKRVIPKGHTRFLAKIAELTDAGIPVHVFTGNHDMWMFGYFEKELGVKMYRAPISRQFNGKHFFIGHGDGLGPGDKGYKFIKKIFASKFCQWLYARFHPNFGIWLATYFSEKGAGKREHENQYKGDDKEFLVQFCNQHLKEFQIDYFIFGHRHLPLVKQIQNATYINLGDWVKYNSFAVFDGTNLELKYFK
jgi:UDP-2,3-diacylglucosamine hydrolase